MKTMDLDEASGYDVSTVIPYQHQMIIKLHYNQNPHLCFQVQMKLEEALGENLKPYKRYLNECMIINSRELDGASEILPHLYLGSAWNAANREELEQNGSVMS